MTDGLSTTTTDGKALLLGSESMHRAPSLGSFSRTTNHVARIAIEAIASIPSAVAYAVVLIVMTVFRDENHVPANDWFSESASPLTTAKKRNRFIRFLAISYKHSLLRRYLNREGPRCSFLPSCSEYAVLAIEKYGLWRGLNLIGVRFRRCNPRATGDYVDFP